MEQQGGVLTLNALFSMVLAVNQVSNPSLTMNKIKEKLETTLHDMLGTLSPNLPQGFKQ